MFAVFGKSLKREYEKSFNRFGVKIKDEYKTFEKNKGCYQISPDFSTESTAMQFIELCKGREETIRSVYIAKLGEYSIKGKIAIDNKTGQKKLKYHKYKAVG